MARSLMKGFIQISHVADILLRSPVVLRYIYSEIHLNAQIAKYLITREAKRITRTTWFFIFFLIIITIFYVGLYYFYEFFNLQNVNKPCRSAFKTLLNICWWSFLKSAIWRCLTRLRINLCHTMSKNSRRSTPEVFLRKGVLKISNTFTGKHPYRKKISIKLLSNFTEITLRHVCSPVNLLRIFRTPFPKNTSGWLLLKTPCFLKNISFRLCLKFSATQLSSSSEVFWILAVPTMLGITTKTSMAVSVLMNKKAYTDQKHII